MKSTTGEQTTMDTNAAQQYTTVLDKLLNDLDHIEHVGTNIFQKIENSLSTAYPIATATAEMNSLISLLQVFESNAKTSGVSSLSLLNSSPDGNMTDSSGKILGSLIEEKSRSVPLLFQQKECIKSNAQAALVASRPN
ncbi:hypothetical protein G9A89_022850 [Geosiphon pyriformis]|nr:hypothetical protein G9A89_022850 [Geosiphon pyriformis]